MEKECKPKQRKCRSKAEKLQKSKNKDLTLSVNHDHDYLETRRSGRLAEKFDAMKKQVPEFSDFLEDYRVAKEKSDLLDRIQSTGQILSLDAVSEDDEQFQYNTGLPSFAVFNCLFDYLDNKAQHLQYVPQPSSTNLSQEFNHKPGRETSLSLKEEFFATLVKLKLGLSTEYLARQFGIAESTFYVIFNTWICFLSIEFEQICDVSSAEVSVDQQTECFIKKFDSFRIVLDCTEFFSQTSGSLSTSQQSYSLSYKHVHAVKYLVGITLSGAVISVSEISDDERIASPSERGNKASVDKGFMEITEDLPVGVKLLILPFKSCTREQSPKAQLELAEKVSAVRLRLGSVLRAIKECLVLESEIKSGMIDDFEILFKLCAFLVNFKKPT